MSAAILRVCGSSGFCGSWYWTVGVPSELTNEKPEMLQYGDSRIAAAWAVSVTKPANSITKLKVFIFYSLLSERHGPLAVLIGH
jgi:hypothetical protein